MNSKPGARLSFGVVILAAGRSQRMGTPKLLLPWNDSTVIEHLTRTWNHLSPRQIAIVMAPDAIDLTRELDRIGIAAEHRIINHTPELGMFSSIQAASAWDGWDESLTHWVLTLGDQPHLLPGTLTDLMSFAAENPERICQPMRNGRRRHPIILPASFFRQIGPSNVPTMKAFLDAHAAAVLGFESDDDGLDLDMDTPEDYERIRPR